MLHNVIRDRVRGVTARLQLMDGNLMPQLGFGTYRLSPEQASTAVGCAARHDFRHFDTAPIYHNQREVGRALRGVMQGSAGCGAPVPRNQLFVVSKLWPTQMRPDVVESACRQTLAELQLEYLDLFLIHWPVAWKPPLSFACFDAKDDCFPTDPATGNAAEDTGVSLKDTWSAMELLVGKGLVRSLGVSNFSADDLDCVSRDCKVRPVTNQVEVHPGLKQQELRAVHAKFGITTTAHCPFGMPTRFTVPDFKGIMRHPYFEPLCERTGFSAARLLLNWHLDSRHAVIVKASTEEHIKDNSKAETQMLSMPVRWMLEAFEAKESVRVMNPTHFRADGRPFFPAQTRRSPRTP